MSSLIGRRRVALDVTLSFESGQWRARGDGIDLAHADLAALDAQILDAASGLASRVHVRFDFGTLPTWLRQYQPHYFNYVLRPGGGRAA